MGSKSAHGDIQFPTYNRWAGDEIKRLAIANLELQTENLKLKKAIAQVNWILFGKLTWASIWPNPDPDSMLDALSAIHKKETGMEPDWMSEGMLKAVK
jgi:hypothetical protein